MAILKFKGFRETRIKTISAEQVACFVCKRSDGIRVTIFQKYFQVYRIPFCGLRKRAETICVHCNTEYKAETIPVYLKERVERLLHRTNTPFYLHTGSVLFFLLLGWALYRNNVNKSDYSGYLESPQPGDLYKLEHSGSIYSFNKLVDVKNDSFLFSPSVVKFKDLKSTIRHAYGKDLEYRNDTIIKYSTGRMKILFDNKKILHIFRPSSN